MMMLPIHIHGSVDDAHTTFLGVEKDYFPRDFKEYMRNEQLNWSRFETDHPFYPTFGWVFWSQLGKSSLSCFLLLFLGAQPQFSFTDNFAELIRNALQKFISMEELEDCLVQFWAPTKTSEGRTLLTTQFLPFALPPTYCTNGRKRLCEYRMGMCREYNNSFYADAECAEEQLGLPGRVFLNQLPESTPHVNHYTLKEYPQRDLAIRCGIGSSWAVPVFDHSGHTCVGVLEIVSQFFPYWHLDKKSRGRMHDIFQEFGLQCFDGCKHYKIQIGDEKKARTSAFKELKQVLGKLCRIHKLPLAMTWVPCSSCNGFPQGKLQSKVVEFSWLRHDPFVNKFIDVSKCSTLRKGVVAGMVLSSHNMLYCSDITKLSLVEYPFVHYAQDCNFSGWFTICLQSSYTANDIYVLEFFLPTSNRWGDNSQTSLSLILGTMEENFGTFKLASGLELGDLLSVDVIDFLNGQKVHSVQKIQAKGGGEMLQKRQLDQASTGAIHSGTNVVSEDIFFNPLVSEDQNYILPSLEALQNEEVTMQLDSSRPPPLDPPNNGQNVVIAEQNIVIVTSSEERKRKTQREHKGTGVRIEVSWEDILVCAKNKMNRKGAAEKLQVSISTLKRVCRGYGIDRWPPRNQNIKKFRSFRSLPVENEGQTQQHLNSDLPSNQGLDCVAHTMPAFHDLPSNQASDSVAHTKPAFQDADIVTIKAKYENNTIKFQLSLPSRLVALEQEVATRLKLEAGTYYIRYEDEENELILIACDQDLQYCIDTFKSLGKTSVVVQLEPKYPSIHRPSCSF